MKITVSIIVPSYNAAITIPETLDSILALEDQDFEAIIIDDGSTDNTREIISPYLRNPKIKYFHQQNKGLAGARNTGIKNSQGNYLVFLDADDIILPNKLNIQKEYLDRHSGVDLVYSNSQWFIENDLDNTRPVNFPIYQGDVLSNLIYGNFIHVNSAMVRRDKVIQVGMFDENLKELEDWDLWLRMCLADSKVGFTPGILSKVRIRKGSMTSDQQRMNSTMVNVIEKMIKLLKTNFSHRKELLLDAHHSLAIYKLKMNKTGAYPLFLYNTSRSLGRRFFPIAIKSFVKYLFRPFIKQNQTTKEIEEIWSN